ncbi:MAG TPA: tryptophan synthase subunit alpha, partial [Pasteurellaceae bacterium]|nr:tryptophan synthase subunit alpha [Pasteurellaceae bacterium]
LLAAQPYIQAAKKYGVQPVFICPPNASDKTIREVAENSEGYTYLVSRAGVTGAENQRCATNLNTLVEQLKAHHSAPILQGFGIAQPQQVKDALAMGVAGAISGSATVNIIAQNLDDHAKCLAEFTKFVRSMKAATRR